MTTATEKPQSAPVSNTSSTDVAELLVAELRARRAHVQDLIRLVNEHVNEHVNEQAGREYAAMPGPRAASPRNCCGSTRRKCTHCPSATNSRTPKLKKRNLPV